MTNINASVTSKMIVVGMFIKNGNKSSINGGIPPEKQ